MYIGDEYNGKLEVFVIRYSVIEELIRTNFNNKRFKLHRYIYDFTYDTWKLYKNIKLCEKDELIEKITELFKTNKIDNREDICMYSFLKCLVYHKIIEPANYLVDVTC